MTATSHQAVASHALDAAEVARGLGVDAAEGLSAEEAARRLREHGPNSLPSEPPPNFWQVALGQLVDPMNLMLVGVAIAGLVIGQTSTSILIGLLVVLNVSTGASQELKARASVDALADLQVPDARVTRDGRLLTVPAVDLVPGDVVSVESGDLVPADGRIVTAAALEVQESALTGESVPVAKDADALDDVDAALGDRTCMAFQNTFVTRGTATLVVTATGSSTEVGRIAGMLSEVERTRSPLQQEMADLTKLLAIVAWAAVFVIVAVGLARGLDGDALILLGIATAISAIPTGLPTFVQRMLSAGARRLADAKAVVKNLTDVETLGATTAINSDKTGTLTLNQMTATRLIVGGRPFSVQGSGYEKSGAILGDADREVPDLTPLALGLALCSDATVADDGTVVGDPTEAALVVLAAKLGVDAEITRREHPRLAEVPFDSAYKFMATFVEDPNDPPTVIELVKGAPDVLLARCSRAYWHGEEVDIEPLREGFVARNRELSERGLRVLSFAVRRLSPAQLEAEEPMDLVGELSFVALVGIIDPLRPSAKEAVRVALGAGIEVRMITGDHAVTARAIADELGLGAGIVSGPEFQRSSDEELSDSLDELHVFGRVAPQDKLRLARLMQERGDVVAMTGDAVNDAAALKQADIGVAMGSGSEVSKQAARMILTDDNFSTLVRAVELGRDVYGKVSAYIRFQLSGLFSILSLMVIATVLDVNDGIALTPSMLLFANFFVTIFPVVAIMGDDPDPGAMDRPPRDRTQPIASRRSVLLWVLTGVSAGLAALVPLLWGPDEPSTDGPSIAMTMAFGVVGLSTLLLGLAWRRDASPAWTGPLWPFVGWLAAGGAVVWLAIELPVLQRWLDTLTLTGSQWLAVIALSLVGSAVVEVSKLVLGSSRAN
ncbi:MAG: cation-transporting P-type ATPase [Actinomycetota bacterium]